MVLVVFEIAPFLTWNENHYYNVYRASICKAIALIQLCLARVNIRNHKSAFHSNQSKPIQTNPEPLDWVDWTIFLLRLDWIEWIGRIDLHIEFSSYSSTLLQPGSPLPRPRSKIHPIDAAKLVDTHLPQLYHLLVAVVGPLVAT